MLWPHPIDFWPSEPLPDQYDLLISTKDGSRPQLLEHPAELNPRHIQFHYGQYKQEQLFEAARRSRACAYLAEHDHGPRAVQEILLAGCPTVGVQIGAVIVRDGITGSWVERLPPGRQFIKNDEEQLLLKACIDMIVQVQALGRSDVRNRAIVQFHSHGIVTQVLNCLSGLRLTGEIAPAAVV